MKALDRDRSSDEDAARCRQHRTRRSQKVEKEHDSETLRFAARVLREVADILEGDDENGHFLDRWREYERVRRSIELRAVENERDDA